MKPAAVVLALAMATALGCAAPHAPHEYDFGGAAETSRAIAATLEIIHEPDPEGWPLGRAGDMASGHVALP